MMGEPARNQRRSPIRLKHIVWALGAVVFAWLVPVGPRDGWQPTDSGCRPQFLADDTTVVTAGSRKSQKPITGPIDLWDIESGTVLRSHFSTDDVFSSVRFERSINKLCLEQSSQSLTLRDHFLICTLRLVDPWTGEEFHRFRTKRANNLAEWIFDDRGRTLACTTDDGYGNYGVVLHDVATGNKLAELPRCQHSIVFSPDGCKIAAYRGYHIHVFDVPSGNQIAHLDPNYSVVAPVAFSRDGNFLVDGRGQVWNVTTSEMKWALCNAHNSNFYFMDDGTTLLAIQKIENAFRLVFFDIASGREFMDRRLIVNVGQDFCSARPATSAKGILSVWGSTKTQPSTLQQLIGRWSYLRSIGQVGTQERFALIDQLTGRELTQGDGFAGDITSDGRFLLNYQPIKHWDGTWESAWTIWDIPARRPVRWVLAAIFGWTVVWSIAVKALRWLGRRFRSQTAFKSVEA
ncbi:MAG: WD40 repeat domain-containing protein [Gemmataceae bacterium]